MVLFIGRHLHDFVRNVRNDLHIFQTSGAQCFQVFLGDGLIG